MTASDATIILGGHGFFRFGIHHPADGLKELAGDFLHRALQTLMRGHSSAVAFGAVFAALTQSSSATIRAVIGFVGAGLETVPQAIGVSICATFGATTTPGRVLN